MKRIAGTLNRILLLLLLARTVGAGAGEGIYTIRTVLARKDAGEFVQVAIMPPQWEYRLPARAALEYEVWCAPENVNFYGGMLLLIEPGKSLRSFPLRAGDGLGAEAELQNLAKGKWHKRRFDLSTQAGKIVREPTLLGCFHTINRVGVNEIRYRNIRLVDADGKVLVDFSPAPGSIPYPLVVSSSYAREVTVTAQDVCGGGFLPERYLAEEPEGISGKVALRNFCPEASLTVRYELTLQNADVAVDAAMDRKGQALLSGVATLVPGEVREVAVASVRVAPGHYRGVLRLEQDGRVGEVRSYAVTILPRGGISARAQPWQKGGFALGGVPLAGAQNPEYMLPALRELGANFYQMRIPWSAIEPAPGVYDLDWIEPILRQAENCGMKVQIDFYSGYQRDTVPAWYQGDEMLTNRGAVHPGSSFCPIGYHSPARQAGLRALEAVLKRYGKDPRVTSWNAWTAGNMDAFYGIKHAQPSHDMMDYSPYAQSAWRTYASQTLQLDLSAASARFGQKLQSWQGLTLPQPAERFPDLRSVWADFIDFRSASVLQAGAEAAQLIRRYTAQAECEFLYGGGIEVFGLIGNDYDIGAENGAKYRGAIHHTAAPGPLNFGYLGGAKRHFGVKCSIETAGTPANVAQHQHAVYELLRQNADGFTWITSPGILKDPGKHYGFGEYKQALELAAGAQPVFPSLALLYSYSQQIIDPFYSLPTGRKTGEVSVMTATRLEKDGLPFDVFTDRTRGVRWAEFPLVLDGFSLALSSSAAREMLSYVQAGGKLVLYSSTGLFTPGDENGRFALLKSLGCLPPADEKWLAPSTPVAADFTEGPLGAGRYALAFFRPLGTLPAAARVLATAAGQPAAAGWTVGKGEVLLFAGVPDWGLAQSAGGESLLTRLTGQFGQIRPPARSLSPDVMTYLHRSGSDYLLILFNQSERPARANVRLEGLPAAAARYAYDLVERRVLAAPAVDGSGVPVFFRALPPYGVAAIRFSSLLSAPPAADAPLRLRALDPPAGAYAGSALLALFREPGGEVALCPSVHSTEPGVLIGTRAQLRLPVPAPGKYRLVAAADRAFAIRLADGTLLFPAERENTETAVFTAPAQGVDLELRSEGGALLEWLNVLPVLQPISQVQISRVFPNPGGFPGKNYSVELLPESPQSKTVGDGVWRDVRNEAGIFEPGQVYKNQTGGLVYFRWNERSESSGRKIYAFGADYGLKLWHNGRLILDSTGEPREGAPVVGEFLRCVKLTHGRNEFLAKLASGSRGWRFWAQRQE